MPDNILYCPFCGGDAHLEEAWAGGQGHEQDHFVECSNCRSKGKSFMLGWNGTEEECKRKAIEAWNIRVSKSSS